MWVKAGLAAAHATIRYLDRDPDGPPGARFDVTGLVLPKEVDHYLRFSMHHELTDAVAEPMEADVFLDEIRFEVFD